MFILYIIKKSGKDLGRRQWNGKIKHSFKWIELKNLKNVDFRPAILKDKLSKSDFRFEHIIYREY